MTDDELWSMYANACGKNHPELEPKERLCLTATNEDVMCRSCLIAKELIEARANLRIAHDSCYRCLTKEPLCKTKEIVTAMGPQRIDA